jgi:hypothetical protein
MKIQVPGYGEMDENDEIKIGTTVYKAKDAVIMLKHFEGLGGIHIMPQPGDPLALLSRATVSLVDAGRKGDKPGGVRALLATSSAFMKVFDVRPAPAANNTGAPEREGAVDATRIMAGILRDSEAARAVIRLDPKDLSARADECVFLYDLRQIFVNGAEFVTNYGVPIWRETMGMVRKAADSIHDTVAGDLDLVTRLGEVEAYLKGPAEAAKKTRKDNTRRDEKVREDLTNEVAAEARTKARREFEDRMRTAFGETLGSDNRK